MTERNLSVYSVKSFQGLDVRTSPLELANNPRLSGRLTLADNVLYPLTGGVSKRYDGTAVTSTSVGATVSITNGFQLRLSDGTDRVIIGTDDGRLMHLTTSGATTTLVTGLTAGTRWMFAAYNDQAICVNGGDPPYTTTGLTSSTTTLAGGWPTSASNVAAHGNRVFMLDNTEMSRLTFSGLNNEADATSTSAGSILISDNDGSVCVGLVPSIEELVIIKGRRPYRLQGNSPTTYALTNLVPTVGSIGAVSRQACFFALNDVWYLSQSGVHNLATTQRFGDLRETFVSEPIESYFRQNTAYTISLNQMQTAVGVYDPQNNILLFAVDTDGDGGNEKMLAYDISLRQWSTWPSLPINVVSMWPVYDATTGITEIWLGSDNGHVYKVDPTSSTNAIDGHFKHTTNLGQPGVEKSLRHLFVYAKEQGAVNLSITVSGDFGSVGGNTYTMSLLGNSKLLGVNWTLGVDPLGAQAQIIKRVDTSVTAEYFELAFRNQNAGENFTVFGYDAMSRPRRLIRKAT